MRRLILAFIAVLSLVQPCSAQQTQSTAPFEATLDNGLTIILRHVATAELTTVMTLYDVGELHEPEGRSGIAHMMEHLLVTCATDAADATTADQWFATYSMQANAQTGPDYTVIATSVPNDALETELQAAAARLSSLSITEADLQRERPRVLQELSHMYDGPPALTARNVARQRVDPSPPGGQRGGQPNVIKALTTEQMHEWYSAYYRVNNATLIVVGDLDLEATASMIGEHFADLEPGKALPPRRDPAPQQLNTTVTKSVDGSFASDIPNGVAMLAFPAPDVNSPEYAAFLIIVPRIHQQMIMKGVTRSLAMHPVTYTPLDDPGAVYIAHTIDSSDEAEAAIKTLWESIDAARTFPTDRPVDHSAFQYAYAPMLGVMRMPDLMLAQNTYGEALRLGRFRQLELSSDELREHTLDATATMLNETGATLFAPERAVRVIVTAETDD